MKTVILAIIVVAFSLDSLAQNVFSNATNIALETVIQDYPNDFRNIRGAVVLQGTNTINYESSVKIPGSLSCIVIQSSGCRKRVSWKADLLNAASFAEASGKYTELYNQIKNTIVKIQGSKPYILNGRYTKPDQGKPLHAVVFNMLPASGNFQRVRVEILLEQQGSSWKLQIEIFDGDYEQSLAVEKRK